MESALQIIEKEELTISCEGRLDDLGVGISERLWIPHMFGIRGISQTMAIQAVLTLYDGIHSKFNLQNLEQVLRGGGIEYFRKNILPLREVLLFRNARQVFKHTVFGGQAFYYDPHLMYECAMRGQNDWEWQRNFIEQFLIKNDIDIFVDISSGTAGPTIDFLRIILNKCRSEGRSFPRVIIGSYTIPEALLTIYRLLALEGEYREMLDIDVFLLDFNSRKDWDLITDRVRSVMTRRCDLHLLLTGGTSDLHKGKALVNDFRWVIRNLPSGFVIRSARLNTSLAGQIENAHLKVFGTNGWRIDQWETINDGVNCLLARNDDKSLGGGESIVVIGFSQIQVFNPTSLSRLRNCITGIVND